MRTKLRSKVTLLFMMVGMLLAIPAVAFADLLLVDGDYVATANPADADFNNPVDLGTVAPGATIQKTVKFEVRCDGTKHLDNGAVVTMTFSPTQSDVFNQSNNAAAASGTVTVQTTNTTDDQVITIGGMPASWPDDVNGSTSNCPAGTLTQAANHTGTITVTAPSTPGAYFGIARFNQSISPSDPQAVSGGNNTQIRYNLTVANPTPPADTTAPTNASIDIDDGAAWTNNTSGNVSLDLSANDNVGVASYKLAETQSGLASATAQAVSPAEANFSRPNVSFTLTGSEAASKAVWLRVCDAQNNCSDASDTIGWDKTAPTIDDLGPTTEPNLDSWYKTNVTNEFKASDSLSGLSTACQTAFPANQAGDNVQSKTTSGEGLAKNVTSDSCTDVAGNTRSGVTSADFKIDLTPPSVSVTGVSNGATYTFGDVPTPGCNTTDGLSDVKTPATVNVTGGTGGFGNLTATCSGAVDNADNNQAAPVSVTYGVSAAFNGFLQPIDGHSVNTGKWGRTYPIKWQLRDSSGALISDTTAQLLVGTMTGGQKAVSCGVFDLSDSDALESSTTGGTSLRYDATSDQFIYNYKAPSTGSCYVFAIRNADGLTTQQIDFQFTK